MDLDALTAGFMAAFLAKPGQTGSRVVEDAGLAEALAQVVAAGQRAWPGVALEPQRFVARVAVSLPSDRSDLSAALVSLHAGDLFLACACEADVPHARESLRTHLRPTVDACATRIDAQATPALSEQIEERLLAVLVGHGGAPSGTPRPGARLGAYRGRTSLRAWVAVPTERVALGLLRAQAAAAGSDEGSGAGRAMADHVALGDDSDLALLSRTYKEDFEAAFAHALSVLTDRERALLRLYLGGKLALPALARIYRTQVSTVAQWIADARQALAAETEAHLKLRLRLPSDQFDSVARTLSSQVEARMTLLLPGLPTRPRVDQVG